MKKLVVIPFVFLLFHLSAQYRYETYINGSADEITLLRSGDDDSLRAFLKRAGPLGMAFYHISPEGQHTADYRLGWPDGSESGWNFVETADGNYAFAGFTDYIQGNAGDAYFGKITDQGEWLWQFVSGQGRYDSGEAIINTQDGGLLLGGYSTSLNAPYYRRPYLVKISADGIVDWEKAFETNAGLHEIYELVELPSGIVAAAGYHRVETDNDNNASLYFFASDGTLLQSTSIGGTGDERILAMMLSPEGTLIAAGITTEPDGFGEGDFFLMEISASGQVLWTQIIGTEMNEYSYLTMGLDMDASGNILMAGYQQYGPFSDDRQGVLVKTDRRGTPLWTRLLLDATQPTDVLTLGNGDIVVAGGNESFDVSLNFLFRTNSSGRSGCGRDSFLLFSSQALSLLNEPITDLQEVTLNTAVVGPGYRQEYPSGNSYECIDFCLVRAGIELASPIVVVDQAVTFTNSSTTADDYRWRLNGVEVTNSTDLNWTFATTGPVLLELIASSEELQCADTAAVQLVVNPPVNAAFTYDQSLFVGHFNGSLSVGTNWFWDFGDGQTATAPEPRHLYADFGTYEVCLTVAQNDETDTQCQEIVVELGDDIAFASEDFITSSSGLSTSAFEDVVATKDGGYATIAGRCLLQKFGADGSVSWRRQFSNQASSANLFGRTLIECRDLGYLIGGEIDDSPGVLIARTDSAGEILWTHNLLAAGLRNGALALMELEDGDFLVCGERSNHGFLMRLDEYGNEVWFREFEDLDLATSFERMSDGTILLAGNDGFGSIFFYQLNPQGEVLSSTGLSVGGWIGNPRLTKASDGNLYVGISTNLEEVGVGVLKIDPQGNLLWSRLFDNQYSNSFFGYLDVHETADQHLFVSYGARSRYWSFVAYLETDGTPIWNKQIRLEEPTTIGNSTINYNGHLVVPGVVNSGLLIQIDPAGQLCGIIDRAMTPVPNPTFSEPVILDSVRVFTPPTAFNNLVSYALEGEQSFYCYNEIDCAPLVDFTVTAEGRLIQCEILSSDFDSVFWNFGDLNTSTEISPTYEYDWAGTYTICLTLYNECGAVTGCQEIMVLQEACSPFSAFSYTQSEPGVVHFFDESINAETWLWDFYDGTLTNEQEPVHVFASPGTYNVCLQITNECGNDLHCEDIVIDGCLANAQFLYDVGDYNVLFSPALPSGALSWEWDFGDGNSSTDTYAEHTYAMAGSYEVCLTVTLDCATETSCQTIELEDCNPVISIDYEQYELTGFSFVSILNGNSFVRWDLGDGTTITNNLHPSHVYEEEGLYTVCLTAENSCGETTYCEEIVVGDCVPTATFVYEQIGPTSLSFVSELSIAANTYWEFGDGSTDYVQNPNHIYSTPGSYTVCLTVYNTCGETTICEDILVAGESIPGTVFDDQLDTMNLFIDPDMIGSDERAQLRLENLPSSIHQTEAGAQFSLNVWPNPALEQLQIELEAALTFDQDWIFELVDQYGKVLLTSELALSQRQSLSIERLPAGLYYYRLSEQGRRLAFGKVVKL